MFQLGQEVLIRARVVGLYGEGRSIEFQSVAVQLDDGQGVMTNIRNCRAAVAPLPVPSPVEPPPAPATRPRPKHKAIVMEVHGG
jgi:hypothetical protein